MKGQYKAVAGIIRRAFLKHGDHAPILEIQDQLSDLFFKHDVKFDVHQFYEDCHRDTRYERKTHTFRLTYKAYRGAPYAACLIEAKDVNEANKKLIKRLGGCWSISRISMQCEATTASGAPCQKFSGEEFCAAHRRNQ